MATRIVLHIGLQKSGTTFLQHMLHANTAALAEAGVRYPVPRDWDRGRRTVANHEWSSYGLLGPEFPWVSPRRAAREASSWRALIDQVDAWPGTALLSAEALSVIRTPAIRRLMDALGRGEIDIVVTARSLGRSLPSLWQQHIRNGHSTSLDAYLESLAGQREKGRDHIENDPEAHIWRAFMLGGLAARWSRASRVTVVTTPGNPPHLLWERFTRAIGVPELAAAPLVREAHSGLTAPEIMLLSAVNMHVREHSGRDAHRVRSVITERFENRTARGGKVTVPPEWHQRLTQWTAEDISALQSTRAHIVGDLSDLRHAPEESPAPTPEETAQAGAEAAVALAGTALREPLLRRATRRLLR